MRVLVIGGSGLVGSNVTRVFEGHNHDVVGTYRSSEGEVEIHLDKTDSDRVREIVDEHNPDVIVDTAAFHAVDDCEEERDKAWTVNATGTRNVAVAANRVDAHLIYFSTDYVFPGGPKEAPYTEENPIRPVNYYGETKYAAEQAAKIAEQSTVLRPSVIYGLESGNFVTWVLGELRGGNEVNIVDDQTSRPTYAPDLASACLDIGSDGLTGLYHATGPQSVSRYEFTVRLADVYGFDEELVTPISTEELGQTAARPVDSSLESSRLYDDLGYEFSTPEEGFEAMKSRES